MSDIEASFGAARSACTLAFAQHCLTFRPGAHQHRRTWGTPSRSCQCRLSFSLHMPCCSTAVETCRICTQVIQTLTGRAASAAGWSAAPWPPYWSLGPPADSWAACAHAAALCMHRSPAEPRQQGLWAWRPHSSSWQHWLFAGECYKAVAMALADSTVRKCCNYC